MRCDDSSEPGGAGCELPVGHDGDHCSTEGATWPVLVEKDCPRCGALTYTAQPDDTNLVCPACQDEDYQLTTPAVQ